MFAPMLTEEPAQHLEAKHQSQRCARELSVHCGSHGESAGVHGESAGVHGESTGVQGESAGSHGTSGLHGGSSAGLRDRLFERWTHYVTMQLVNDYPIILHHGIARFDELFVSLREKKGSNLGPHYYNGVRDYLRERGFEAIETHVEFAASVETRAHTLREKILAATTSAKVHIIAHSMGGLDARHMIVDLGMADRVASLTTIATPHNGSLLADELLGKGGDKLVSALKPYLDLDGFHDLTVEACGAFNVRAADAEGSNGVRYIAVSAYEEEMHKVFTPLIPSWRFLEKHVGPNDGLVPVSSQEWNAERAEIRQFPFRADHLNEIGWFPGVMFSSKEENAVREVYAELARAVTST